ncbi:pyridoxamine 5-phosphate oxidase [Plantibacter flavus]|uniref:DegT/DnrJ/EryC1/StrS family aminotransferase n=1 Tax=Plantibacter TaxID=190323 RepID=UPI0010C2445D|nr:MULTISPECIES: DegT/DnrJ/EryC1/StrS family aminotransferase [Plantibacter]MBD8103550.1 DegT/DnrJ/EryC1/StrS family aminotransferase [Plantibacter sp. CFBP 8775]MBD8516596.1 DegT/DnrJ/EryC1/StrS family aminotransferase [Plantibacter sp. CFBP 8804]TKJ96511.1 pyridoxamine 5-phosphate oxidase [Plantibacter flavus]
MTDDTFDSGFPLATSSWDAAEYAAIQRVVDSGRFTMGPLVAQFERDFAGAFGAGFGVMVNSGSSANLLAIAAAVLDDRVDLQAGDEVLVPAVSWATTYYPLQQYGLIPSFVDIDVDTLNLDLSLAEAAITPRTKAIFAVNLLGNPNDFAALTALAERHGLLLLEDNCESLGAKDDGRFAGTVGAMGTFSAFFSHHISTMEGGMILTDDEATAQMLISLRAHGWTRGLPEQNAVHDKSGDEWDDLFRFVLPGYNVRPLEMSGAIGIEQIQKVPQLIAGRRENAVYWTERFADLDSVRIQREQGESSWFGFSLVLEGALAGRRKEVVQAFAAEGIESRPIVAGNFTKNPVMKYLDAKVPAELPAADKIHEDGLFVGNHHFPVHAGIDRVYDVVAKLS